MGHMAERWSLYKMQSFKMCCASFLSAPHSHLAVSPTLKQLNIWHRSLLWPHLSLKIVTWSAWDKLQMWSFLSYCGWVSFHLLSIVAFIIVFVSFKLRS